MKRLLLPLLLLVLCSISFADEREKDIERIQAAGAVLDEIMSAPDRGIPHQIMGSAECVAVVPSLLKGGFVFGAELGRGVATCRNSNGWSAPAFFRIEGGSFGFQIGGQAVDLVMLIMNQRGMQALLSSHFKLGADASAAAGPVGRLAEGMTDLKMRAEVLTYSRARGLFAGVSLNGAIVKQHKDDTRAFYRRMIPFKTLLTGGVTPPAEAQPFLAAVQKYNAGKEEPKAVPAASTNTTAPHAAEASTNTTGTVNTAETKTDSKTAAQPAAQPASSSSGKPDPTNPEPK